MKTKRTFSLSPKGKVLAFCLGEKTKALMPTSFLARAAMMLLVMVLTTTTWAQSTFSGGSGTSKDPYKISSTADLDQLATAVNGGNNYKDKYFVMTADIKYNPNAPTIDYDSNGVYESNFTPIGGLNKGFFGTFDGQGYSSSLSY